MVPVPRPPTITSLTPATGAGGMTVTIEGTWFGNTGRVLFGDIDAVRFEVQAFDRLVAVAPAGVPGPEVTVRVVGPGGTSNGMPFSYAAATA